MDEHTFSTELAAALRRFMPRDPRYRYWQTPDGRMFMWTTERMGDGKFASAVMVPTGPGSRSGRAHVTRWRATREVHHVTRRAAKARAYRLFTQHRSR